MTAKKLLITAALIVVAMIYYYLYGDAFKKHPVEIIVTMRPQIGRRMPWMMDNNNEPAVEMAVFNMGREYNLTSIKVVPLSDAETNKYPHPIWEMISESNSIPTSTFAYGRRIRGMHPSVKGAAPGALLPETGYRILVETARHEKGEHDFKTPPEMTPPQ